MRVEIRRKTTIIMQDLENEIIKQVNLFSKGESYLFIKQELQDNYDEITASKIAQEAYKRHKLKKTKKNIKDGLILFVIAQIAIFFIKAENIRFSYLLRAILGVLMVLFGLWQIYNYQKKEAQT